VQLDEAIWDSMQFASDLHTRRLGEFTIGSGLHRSEAFGLTQLLLLYHLVTARAVIALGTASAPSISPALKVRPDPVPAPSP
jgi:phosphoribulokinase